MASERPRAVRREWGRVVEGGEAPKKEKVEGPAADGRRTRVRRGLATRREASEGGGAKDRLLRLCTAVKWTVGTVFRLTEE